MDSVYRTEIHLQTRNISVQTFLVIGCVWVYVGLWRLWFLAQSDGFWWQTVAGLAATWTFLVLLSARDPGFVTEENVGRYRSAFGEDEKGMVKRAYLAKRAGRYVARYDHFSTFLGYEVGALNHVRHHAMLAVALVLFFATFFSSMTFYAEQREWVRPVWFPPIAWEGTLLMELFAELYCRLLAAAASAASWTFRYFLWDHKWLLTDAWGYTNFIFLLYHVPMFVGAVLGWYGFGYAFFYLYHAVLLACGNMTIYEEAALMEKGCIPLSLWISVTGLNFVVWADVVGVMCDQSFYKFAKVLDDVKAGEPEEVPEGWTLIGEKSQGWWDAGGTVCVSRGGGGCAADLRLFFIYLFS